MFKLEKIADAFDKMHAEVQRDLDDVLLVKGGQTAGKAFGPDSVLTWSMAISAGIAWSLSTFTLGAGKSLVDVLRLGEGVKSGTLSGVASDVLRVLNLIPALGVAAKGIGMGGRLASIAGATRVAGGAYQSSCGATASAAAARLSGTRLLLTLDEVGNFVGKGSPKSPQFPGMWFHEIKSVLMGVTSTTQEINMSGAGIEAVEAAAAQGRGPVVFGVQWWRGVQPLRNAAIEGSAGDHWLVAFRNVRGQIMVADQYGVRPITQIGSIQGTTSQFTLASRALLVGDGALIRGLGTLESTGQAMVGASKGASWLATSFGLQMVVVNAPTTWSLDATVRKKLGRPPRDWPGQKDSSLNSGKVGGKVSSPSFDKGDRKEIPPPSSIPVPNPSSTLLQDSTLVLNKLPQNGDSREFAQLMVETGLSSGRLRNALFQLGRSGLIRVLKWSSHEDKPTPIMVQRTLRK